MSKLREQIGNLKDIVLRQLGRDDFEKDAEGKAVLTEKDKEALQSAFTPAFIEKFERGLDTDKALKDQEEAASATMDQLKADSAARMKEMEAKVNAAMEKADGLSAAKAKLETEKKALQEAVDALSELPGADDGQVIQLKPEGVQKSNAWYGVKPNGKHFHTQMAQEYLQGNTGKAMGASSSSFGTTAVPGMAGNTVNVDELYEEFGTYLSQFNIRLDILQKLIQKTESQMYMTTKQAITEWRAATGLITSVVQQFVAKWTPLGTSKFTPVTIKNRHHKVNLPITPDDINDSWLSYLYDEGMTPDQMPVTRYIIEQMLRPKIEEDIELLMIATGEFEELGTVTENDAGQATGKSMDGYITILKNKKAAGTSNINFFTPSQAITDDSIVDVLEEYADWVEDEAPLYAKKGMNIFIDPVLLRKFDRRYRELYPTTKNEDGNRRGPDFSNLKFVDLEAMRGSNTFFSTPKENFIRLIHKNAAGGETKLFLQVENYTVKVFAEFWLGVGFALEELVFAYVPDASSSSGSGSGA
jgi:hypothetical protein